jgi:hypothetical protein
VRSSGELAIAHSKFISPLKRPVFPICARTIPMPYYSRKEQFMDAFWVIPVGIIAIIATWWFVAALTRRNAQPSPPHVLVDKESAQQPLDPAQSRDFAERPCGSFMDWIAGRGKRS